MTTKAYAFAKGQPIRLAVQSGDNWKTTYVLLDGHTIATVPDKETLKEGVNIRLTDGSKLEVRKVSSLLGTQFAIDYNGQPLHKTLGDVVHQVRNACLVLYVIAALNILIGLLISFLNSIKPTGYEGLTSIIAGLIFCGLALWTKFTGSKVPLGISLGIIALDSFLVIVGVFSGGERISALSWLITRTVFIIYIWRAIDAITYQPDAYYSETKQPPKLDSNPAQSDATGSR